MKPFITYHKFVLLAIAMSAAPVQKAGAGAQGMMSHAAGATNTIKMTSGLPTDTFNGKPLVNVEELKASMSSPLQKIGSYYKNPENIQHIERFTDRKTGVQYDLVYFNPRKQFDPNTNVVEDIYCIPANYETELMKGGGSKYSPDLTSPPDVDKIVLHIDTAHNYCEAEFVGDREVAVPSTINPGKWTSKIQKGGIAPTDDIAEKVLNLRAGNTQWHLTKKIPVVEQEDFNYNLFPDWK